MLHLLPMDGLYYFDLFTEDDIDYYGSVANFLVATVDYYLQKGYQISDIIEGIASICKDSYSYTGLTPSSKYYAFAVSINNNFVATAEPKMEEFHTEKVEMSDLTIEISQLELSPVGGRFTITPSNNSKEYLWYAVTKDEADQFGRNTYGLAQAIVNSLAPYNLINDFRLSGSQEVTIDWLDPTSEYVLCAFGYDGTAPNTNAFIMSFTTTALYADPCEVTFEIKLSDDLSKVTFIPSEPAYYFWNGMSKVEYDDMIESGLGPVKVFGYQFRELVQYYADGGGDAVETAKLLCDITKSTYPITEAGVRPSEESVIYCIAADVDNVYAACDEYYAISEPFTITAASAVSPKMHTVRLNNANRNRLPLSISSTTPSHRSLR